MIKRRVIITVSPMPLYEARLFAGIIEYVRSRASWEIETASSDDSRRLSRLLPHYDGIISYAWQAATLDLLEGCDKPVVNVLDDDPRRKIGFVVPDERAVGALGAQHFLARRYRSLAYCGRDVLWSKGREEGFVKMARVAGVPVAVYPATANPLSWDPVASRPKLRGWLQSLTYPTGVMACNDTVAAWVVEEAQELGLRVPGDIPALGVDNEDMRCQLRPISLSSIDLNLPRIGFEAAKMLDDLMEGRLKKPTRVLVPPQRVVARLSTQWAASGHQALDDAVRLIHESEGMELNVDEVAETIGIPRRSLERLFRKRLSNSVGAEIRRARMERLRRLVLDTNQSLTVIAEKCGFNYLSHMSCAYRRQYGVSPARDRLIHRGALDGSAPKSES